MSRLTKEQFGLLKASIQTSGVHYGSGPGDVRDLLDTVDALEAEIAALQERHRICHESAVGLRETVAALTEKMECEHQSVLGLSKQVIKRAARN